MRERLGNGGDPRERIKAAFERFDTDGDGVLVADDLPFPQFFERLDLDGDGKLTREEAEKAVEMLRREQGPGQ
jgi:Ca2+-binding EF-hand superfamily protein